MLIDARWYRSIRRISYQNQIAVPNRVRQSPQVVKLVE